ncbi:hypothetical protein [Sphingomonas jatrophae]|uniref:ATPase n=1 Tax=Sphingomonas jatrophae TaxID=1166337 RepID=A0A1I6JV97_9SPHN|nr:hypothetical protein [Sphingomonas jatrophae]SFR82841.1 hypothetical protein SAMN05192580_0927 [Sphingomonas jatrophae]
MGIRGIRAEIAPEQDLAAEPEGEPVAWAGWVEDEAEDAPVRTPLDIAAAAVAIVLALGWLVIVIYAARVSLRTSGDRLVDLFLLLPAATAPLALIGIVWLLAQRTSRREARRFARTAAAMRIEAAGMEAVLARIGGAIDENRRLLADQADQLLALGEEAAARLAHVRGGMAEQSTQIGRQTQALDRAATTARSEMDALLADLPRAEAQTHALAERLRDGGTAANQQAGALTEAISTLTTRAREADETVNGAAQRLASNLAGMERQGTATARLLTEAAGTLRGQVDDAMSATATALAAARESIDAQGSATMALIDQSRSALERTGSEAAAAFGERLDGAAARLDALGQRLVEQDSASRALVAKLEQGLAAVEERLASLDETGRERTATLDDAVATLRTQAERATLALNAGAGAAGELTGQAEALRQVIDGIGREIDSLPPSFDAADAAAQRSRASVAATGPEVARLEAAARAAAERLTLVQARFAEQQAAADRLGESVAARIAEIEAHGRVLEEIETRFASFGDAGAERTADLAEAIVALSGHAQAISQTFGSSVTAADTLAARTASLGDTIARVGTQADRARETVTAALPEAQSLERAVERAIDRIGGVDAAAAERRAEILAATDAAEARLGQLTGELDRMHAAVARIGTEANAVAESATPRLVEALLRVRETANVAANAARDAMAGIVPAAAQALGDAAGAALEASVSERVEAQMQAVGQAAERAVAAAHQATDRLMRQMLTITDTTTAIEARIEEAQTQIAEREEDSFARRTALLIESLNSTAIDVAKVFATDVADNAWAAYLRGDRGVFTRRAVRLLDAAETREIARYYEERADFREQVNRYIHDFEAMLRRVLAGRDGAPMSVTLLSSDMGKLYVALAQAIERLRA